MILLRILAGFALGVLVLAAIAAGLVVYAVMFPPEIAYDRTHADYAAFTDRFAQARRAFADGQDWVVIDLGPANGGAWRSACLFGGYTRPVSIVEGLGGVVSAGDRARLPDGGIGFRLSAVEEYEMLLAYVDTDGRAHFVHFDTGVGAEGQHYEACVAKPETKVAIESWNHDAPRTPSPID